MLRKHASTVLGAILLTASPGVADEAVPTPEQVQFFETKIRPVLAENCYKCHGPDEQKGELRLDNPASALAGGLSGPAIVPGNPDESMLVEAVRYGLLQMPPTGRLDEEEVEDLVRWVAMGAPWPGAGEPVALKPRTPGLEVTDADRQFWSFQPIRKPPVPEVRDPARVRNPIDAFILARLEDEGLEPSPPASRRELIRRVYFDLIGLPPTPEAIEAFAADESPDAYERLVDDLLARPQYGRRWARHWLDVVRFAQTNGYERDDEKPFSWRFRDYVINSFNIDKPYDQFVREQLAGDELTGAGDEAIIATAFYRLGVWDDEPDDARQAEFDNLDDMLSTAGSAFLGLTIGCARCHDHKFDPIPTEDYYGMLAFLRNIKPSVKADDKKADETILATLSDGSKTLAVHERGTEVPPTHVLIRGAAATPGPEVVPRFPRVLCPSDEAAVPELPPVAPDGRTSGRRRVLAEWVTRPENPLTARVIVNRLWHHHFGRGIVPTPSDFGHTGLAPSHPDLLDWLASELISGGWRLKRIHKLILMSSAYRQSSRSENERAIALDPDNTLIWRQNFRRLEAEAIRDAILATSGRLNPEMGGRGIFPDLPPEVLATQSRPGNGWDDSDESQRSRRSVYIFAKRTLGVPFLEVFDVPSADTPTADRASTTIAPQALTLLNSRFLDEQSAALADRLMAESGGSSCDGEAEPIWPIELAFRIVLGRLPSEDETRIAQAYLDRQADRLRQDGGRSEDDAHRFALTTFCKLMFNLNEFVYID